MVSFSDGFSLLAEDARGRERGERTARELWVREGQERPHAILALGKAGERHFVVAGGRRRPGLAGTVPRAAPSGAGSVRRYQGRIRARHQHAQCRDLVQASLGRNVSLGAQLPSNPGSGRTTP